MISFFTCVIFGLQIDSNYIAVVLTILGYSLNDTIVIYDRIRELGISMVVAASNSFNSTYGSEKNGNLPLTSNPDSGPVGAPATYQASLAVASVDGVKTPYLRHENDLFYFKEATAADAKPRHFVDEILDPLGVDSYNFEYVTIPGIGRSSDYPEDKEFYKGKIVLVKRGTTTFEDKIKVAINEIGAAGIIIYNNVSGNISQLCRNCNRRTKKKNKQRRQKLLLLWKSIAKVVQTKFVKIFLLKKVSKI